MILKVIQEILLRHFMHFSQYYHLYIFIKIISQTLIYKILSRFISYFQFNMTHTLTNAQDIFLFHCYVGSFFIGRSPLVTKIPLSFFVCVLQLLDRVLLRSAQNTKRRRRNAQLEKRESEQPKIAFLLKSPGLQKYYRIQKITIHLSSNTTTEQRPAVGVGQSDSASLPPSA